MERERERRKEQLNEFKRKRSNILDWKHKHLTGNYGGEWASKEREHDCECPRVYGSVDQLGTPTMLLTYRCSQGRETYNKEMRPKRFFKQTIFRTKLFLFITELYSL